MSDDAPVTYDALTPEEFAEKRERDREALRQRLEEKRGLTPRG